MEPVVRRAALPASVASRPVEHRVLPEERAEVRETRAAEVQRQGPGASPVPEWLVVELQAPRVPLQVPLELAQGPAGTRRGLGGSLAQGQLAQGQLAQVVPVRPARAALRVPVALQWSSSDRRSSRLGRALIGKRVRSR
jgi:hypothetical protein